MANGNGDSNPPLESEIVGALVALRDVIHAHQQRLDALESGTPNDKQLVELDRRLRRLETSDFAKNRDDFRKAMTEVEEGMPEIPPFPT